MIKQLKQLIGQYPKDFWIFILILSLVSILIFYINNYSNIPTQYIIDDTIESSRELSEILLNTETTFNDYKNIIESLTEDKKNLLLESDIMQLLISEIAVINYSFAKGEEIVSGYFFHVNSEQLFEDNELYFNTNNEERYSITKLLDISTIQGSKGLHSTFLNNPQSIWINIKSGNNQPILAYVTPIYSLEEYIGFMGFTIDMQYIQERYFDNQKSNDNQKIFLDENQEILIYKKGQTGINFKDAENGLYSLVSDKIQDNLNGFEQIKIDNKNWIVAFEKLTTGQIYVEAWEKASRLKESNQLIALIVIIVIGCIIWVQYNKISNTTPFHWLIKNLMGSYLDTLTPIESNSMRAAIAIHTGIIGVLVANFLYRLVNIGNSLLGVILYGIMVILSILSLYIYRFKRLSFKISYFYISAILIVPLMILYLNDTSLSDAYIFIWTLTAAIIALFLLGAKKARKIFDVFLVILFVNVFIEYYLNNNEDYRGIYMLTASLIYLGYALFTSMDIYVTSSTNDYNKISDLLNQLKNAQSSLVQKEKMVILGQLIAGIAHEINTPIGAIKASAETLDTSFEKMLSAIMKDSREFTPQDYIHFFRLVTLASDSVGEMKSTIEMRREKIALRKFLLEEGFESGSQLADLLARFEICSIDKIKENMDILKVPNILQLLNMLQTVSPYINGTQTILFATGKVTKIVFALKSYAHTNLSGEFTQVDLVKSIENVLILYHNQLKININVIKYFESNVLNINGNSDELSQVWTNLIQNAIHAMSTGGTLTISVYKVKQQDLIAITFSDTGCGIDKTHMDRLFEPFYTTKMEGEGTGLGLDICKKIITRHGGTITVDSVLNEGTTFNVELPIIL